VLIDPQRWLPELVRFIHYAPVDANLVTAAQVWPHSSHAVYCNGARAPAWLNTRATFQVLKRRGVADSETREFLCVAPSSEERHLFAVNGHSDSRVLDVSASSPARPSPSAAPRLTVARIMDLVAQLLDVPLAGITSTSRRHDLSLARSVIAWQVIERRLTSLTGIAAILRRDPSTLSKAIARHRRLQPHLFRLDALRTLLPLR
jgi:hypothetical protein